MCGSVFDVARCTVERLMRELGLRGVRRGKQVVTIRPDEVSTRPPDHVQREFSWTGRTRLWVVDFTGVPTWSGMAFTAFVTDVLSRRIVGWRTMSRMPTDLPLDALEMALWIRDRAGQDVTGVIQHSDAGASWASSTGAPCFTNSTTRSELLCRAVASSAPRVRSSSA
ncbi:DDE-type integrase/transposase/recombinase [Agromyces intestinalis]